MQATTKSPIFSDFSEVVEGIVTIRAFSAERMFLNRMHENIDVTTKVNPSSFFWVRNSPSDTPIRCGTHSGWPTVGCCSTSTVLVPWAFSLRHYLLSPLRKKARPGQLCLSPVLWLSELRVSSQSSCFDSDTNTVKVYWGCRFWTGMYKISF